MRRGQFFWFDVLDSHHRPLLTERSLMLNLQAIVSDADKVPPGQVAQGAIGVLSTENRKVWASLRGVLAEDEDNKACLDIVDSALFVVCLDDTEPKDAHELSSSMLSGTYKLENGVQVGTCTNRYYDKVRSVSCIASPLLTSKRSCKLLSRRMAQQESISSIVVSTAILF